MVKMIKKKVFIKTFIIQFKDNNRLTCNQFISPSVTATRPLTISKITTYLPVTNVSVHQ